MSKKQEKPGVMIYFSVLDALACMTDAEKGILFEAILRFGRDGEEPERERMGQLMPLWHLLKANLIADNRRYYEVTARRQYAAYVRWCKEKQQETLDYDDWLKTGEYEKKRTYLDADHALA